MKLGARFAFVLATAAGTQFSSNVALAESDQRVPTVSGAVMTGGALAAAGATTYTVYELRAQTQLRNGQLINAGPDIQRQELMLGLSKVEAGDRITVTETFHPRASVENKMTALKAATLEHYSKTSALQAELRKVEDKIIKQSVVGNIDGSLDELWERKADLTDQYARTKALASSHYNQLKQLSKDSSAGVTVVRDFAVKGGTFASEERLLNHLSSNKEMFRDVKIVRSPGGQVSKIAKSMSRANKGGAAVLASVAVIGIEGVTGITDKTLKNLQETNWTPTPQERAQRSAAHKAAQ